MGFSAIAAFLTLAGQGQTVTGQVLRPDGTPAGGATVRIYRQVTLPTERVTEAVADANGRFQITADLPDPMRGASYVVAEAPGLAIGFGLYVPQGKRLTLHLGKPVRTTVRFLMPDGKPAQALAVTPRLFVRTGVELSNWLTLPNALRERFRVRTDAQGRAVFANLPEGCQCEVEIFDERFARLNYRERFEIKAAPATEAPIIKLRRGGFATGRVMYKGLPVPGVHVFAQSVQAGGYGAAISDAHGRFRLSQLQAGEYNVALNLEGKQGEQYTARALVLNVAEGEEKKDLVLKLETGGLVTGKVLRPNGKPAAQVPVGVYGPARPRSGAAVQSTLTDSDGMYQLRVPAGEQFVYVQLEGDGMRTLTVKEGESAQADFLLKQDPEPTVLQGTVLDPEGKPVEGAVVKAQGKDARFYIRSEAETDEAGRFKIVIHSPSDALALEVRKGDLYAASIDPDADGDTEIRTVRGGLVTLGGVVRDVQGRPIPGAQILLMRRQNGTGRSVAEVRTDAQGRYRFADQFPNREYMVSAVANGYGSKHTTDRLMPKKGENLTFPIVTLIKADQSLMGRVVDENGKPMAGVQVSSQADDRETTTDAQGKFRLTGLPKGKIPVLARKGDVYLTRAYETGRVEYELVLKRADGSATSRADLNPVAVGQPAPEIEAKDWLNGSPTSLKALRGRIVVLDFWAIWCGPCREELPKVRAMAERFKAQKVAVIGMHDASTWPKELQAFAAKNKMTYLLGIDQKVDQHGFGKTADRYGVNGIPTVVVIDRDGKVASVSNDADTAQATVERLLKK
jgi:peroxiredoxin/5-hydroxyisourate hydrolase-like protein (transthyretin family)